MAWLYPEAPEWIDTKFVVMFFWTLLQTELLLYHTIFLGSQLASDPGNGSLHITDSTSCSIEAVPDLYLWALRGRQPTGCHALEVQPELQVGKESQIGQRAGHGSLLP